MKGPLKSKLFAIMISVLLVVLNSPAAYAASFGSSSNARIRLSPYNVELNVGEKGAVMVDYDELKEYEDENININEATARPYDPEIVKANFGNNDSDIFTVELTGLAAGKTTVYVAVGRHRAQISVTVKGPSSSETANQPVSASSKSALEKALDSAIKKSATKDATISTTGRKTPAIDPATLKALASAAEQAGKRAIIRVDSLSPKGKIQARIYLDPASLANLQTDYKTAVSTDASRKASLGGKYIASVKCAYTGSFGKYTEIAVKVNAPDDVSKLSFYNVDSKGNFKKIDKPACFLDKNGVLHFFTKRGGETVIMNGAL